jgi:hypothetical protein
MSTAGNFNHRSQVNLVHRPDRAQALALTSVSPRLSSPFLAGMFGDHLQLPI